MLARLDQLYQEALELPVKSKVSLAERLVEYVETHVDPKLERVHLDTVQRRRDEMRSGRVEAIGGDEGLARARKILRK
jgi:hypothetical protein